MIERASNNALSFRVRCVGDHAGLGLGPRGSKKTQTALGAKLPVKSIRGRFGFIVTIHVAGTPMDSTIHRRTLEFGSYRN